MRTIAIPNSEAVEADLRALDGQLAAVARSVIARVKAEPSIGARHPKGLLHDTGALRVRFDRHDRFDRPLREHDAARPGAIYGQRRYRVIYLLSRLVHGDEEIQLLEILAVGDAHPAPGTDTVYRVAQRRLTSRRPRR